MKKLLLTLLLFSVVCFGADTYSAVGKATQVSADGKQTFIVLTITYNGKDYPDNCWVLTSDWSKDQKAVIASRAKFKVAQLQKEQQDKPTNTSDTDKSVTKGEIDNAK